MDRPTHANNVAIDKYKSGDDFEEWASRFEIAVGLAHSVGAPAQREQRDSYCLQWLPLKVDESTWTVFKNVRGITWEQIKAELITLLTDPQEKYDWFAGRNPIVWDGKESFHALAARIKRKVNKHISDPSREREYFHRFRFALPPEYRRAIDLGCGDKWEVEEAMKIAGRLRIADTDAAAATAPKEVAFTGAAMADDRIKSLEMAVQGLSVTVEGLGDKLEKVQVPQGASRDRENARYAEGRSPSRGRDDRGRRDDSRGGPRHDSRDRDRNRDRYDSRDRDRGQSRGRYDSRDRRDPSRNRYDSRDRDGDRYRGYEDRSRRDDYNRRSGYDRGPSYDRRPDYDWRPRGDSRDRDSRRFGRSPSPGRRYDQRPRNPGGYSRDFRDNYGRDYRGSPGRYRDRYDNRDRNAAMNGTMATYQNASQPQMDPQEVIANIQRCLRPALPEN